jgi:hypothetical protein
VGLGSGWRSVVLQAFMDESYTQSGAFVLAGYISTSERWAAFSRECEELLPLAKIGPDGKRRFKMLEMVTRMADVPAFYRVIENHVLMSVAFKIDSSDLARARNRIWMPDTVIGWGFANDPYQFCFELFLGTFHTRLATNNFAAHLLDVVKDNKIDFYFDEQSSKKAILEGWANFITSREDAEGIFGARPRFENDYDFLRYYVANATRRLIVRR